MKFEHDGKRIPIAPDYKDPDTTSDCRGCDWSNWLLSGETVNTSVWISTPAGLTHVSDTNSGTITEVCLSGGTAGTTYLLTNQITTTGGSVVRSENRSMYIKCADL